METTYTNLRDRLASVLDQVRRKRSKDVALIPAAELAGLMERRIYIDRRRTPNVCSPRCGEPASDKGSRSRSLIYGVRWALSRPAERVAVFHPKFREDLRYWVETDRRIALRIFELIEAIVRSARRKLISFKRDFMSAGNHRSFRCRCPL